MAVLPFRERPVSGQSGGDGPMGPSIDARVAALEQTCSEMNGTLKRVEKALLELSLTSVKIPDLQKVHMDVAEIKGRISMLPTWWMLMVTVLSTWTVGAGIVFTVVKFARP